MAREQEINQEVARYLFEDFKPTGVITEERFAVGVHMAKWADEHPKNPWRSLLDEMPPVKQTVLFLDTNGRPHLGYNNIDQKSATVGADSPNGKVTLQYWMPIPELPKGGKK